MTLPYDLRVRCSGLTNSDVYNTVLFHVLLNFVVQYSLASAAVSLNFRFGHWSNKWLCEWLLLIEEQDTNVKSQKFLLPILKLYSPIPS